MKLLSSLNGRPPSYRIIGSLSMPLLIFLLVLVMAFIFALFLILPVVALVSSFRYEDLLTALESPHLSKALVLSIVTTIISSGLILLFGTPLAYMLERFSFKGKGLLILLLDLPMVIPPSVAGLGLLLVFGRRGIIGEGLNEIGISLSFTTIAVIIAQVFISAPFFIRSARSGFVQASVELELMARSLGANWWSSFKRVTMPLAKPLIITGLITSWARSLGEFGATIMFAGNFIGKTETLPLAIFSAMNEDMGVAIVLANILLSMSVVLLVTVRIFLGEGGQDDLS